ncbi:MAG: VOC family protein [Acidimicrobiales bacterium]
MNGEPYYFTLGVADPARGEAFYSELFGWELDHGHITNLALSGGIAPPEFGLGPKLYLACADVAAGVARVRELGGTATDVNVVRSGELSDCTDDQRTPFSIGWIHPEMEAEQMAGLPDHPEPRAQLGYLTIGVPDVDRAVAFFAGLFGWEAEPPAPNRPWTYRHVISTELPLGFTDHGQDGPLQLYFRVDDGPAVAAEVERLGGTVGEPDRGENGYSVAAHDDQGTSFSIWQPAPGL